MSELASRLAEIRDRPAPPAPEDYADTLARVRRALAAEPPEVRPADPRGLPGGVVRLAPGPPHAARAGPARPAGLLPGAAGVAGPGRAFRPGSPGVLGGAGPVPGRRDARRGPGGPPLEGGPAGVRRRVPPARQHGRGDAREPGPDADGHGVQVLLSRAVPLSQGQPREHQQRGRGRQPPLRQVRAGGFHGGRLHAPVLRRARSWPATTSSRRSCPCWRWEAASWPPTPNPPSFSLGSRWWATARTPRSCWA